MRDLDKRSGPREHEIAPLVTGTLPAVTPEASVGLDTFGHLRLPSRRACNAYVQRAIQEIHYVQWLRSTESLYTQIELTYKEGITTKQSAGWLCLLFSIFALGSLDLDDDRRPDCDEMASAAYLTMAKSLVPLVCDEADFESIQALSLLVSLHYSRQPCSLLRWCRVLLCSLRALAIRHIFILALQSASRFLLASSGTRFLCRSAWWKESTRGDCGGHSSCSTRRLHVLLGINALSRTMGWSGTT